MLKWKLAADARKITNEKTGYSDPADCEIIREKNA